MTNELKTKSRIISDLLAPFPPQSGGDAKTIIAAYLKAVEPVPDRFVGEAAGRLLAGDVQRNNAAFAPSPTELALEAKRLWHKALDEDKRRVELRAQLEALPEPEKTPESRARVKALVDQFVGNAAANMQMDDREADKRRKALFKGSDSQAYSTREGGYPITDALRRNLHMPVPETSPNSDTPTGKEE